MTRHRTSAVVLVGAVAQLVVWLVLHLAFLGDHSDDTLRGVGLLVQSSLAAVAVGLAVPADRLTSRG
jgi:hypothetical protein